MNDMWYEQVLWLIGVGVGVVKLRCKSEQFVPNQISNLCQQIYKYPMFESSEFLALYLPTYCLQVIQRTYSSNSIQKTQKSDLKLLSQFLKFSNQLYKSLGLQKKFKQLIQAQLTLQNSSPPKKMLKQVQNEAGEKKSKIIEFIEQRNDKVSFIFIQLFIQIYVIQIQSEQIGDQNLSIKGFSDRMLKLLGHARLEFQLLRLQFSNLNDYDDYAIQVFNQILSEDVSGHFQQIIRQVIANEYSNLSDFSINQIEYALNKKGVEPLTSRLNLQQKQSMNLMKKVLGKKHKKIEKSRFSPLKRKLVINQKSTKQESLTISPCKSSNSKNKQFGWSPMKKLQSFKKLKKQKQEIKKRTIYYQRRTVHTPKYQQLLNLGKMNTFGSESTIGSIQRQRQRKAERKMLKFQNSQSTYQDFDNQSILVRSTPKPNKKVSFFKAISHKLDF